MTIGLVRVMRPTTETTEASVRSKVLSRVQSKLGSRDSQELGDSDDDGYDDDWLFK